MSIKTKVTELLGIKYPVIQGCMQWISTASFVAAVSEAGGLGILSAATQPDVQALREEIRAVRRKTDKPFALNVSIFPTINAPDYQSMFAAAMEEGVRIIETAGRAPQEFMDFLKKNGAIVMHKCTTVKHALKAESIGCDLVVADGCECAGHPGENDIGSIVLSARAAEELHVPFISCGGFSNGRGLAAALMLGAGAVTMGTRFMATEECPILPQIKEYLAQNITEMDTMLIMRAYKNTIRAYANDTSKEILRMEKTGAPFEQIAPLAAGRRGRAVLLESADMRDSVLSMGLSAGLVHDIVSVRELIERTVREAKACIRQYAAA
ncbi:MAG: nitronate monooxygenase family protein [Deltaproteobacteria bacterium]|jgi:nitronate monooxygenase|nr:nitronate monooxygenase family protein [Deltaproteobacteria bacterium]